MQPWSVHVYTDGSRKTVTGEGDAAPVEVAACAFAVWQGGRRADPPLDERAWTTGDVTAFDAEMEALGEGLVAAIRQAWESIRIAREYGVCDLPDWSYRICIYADNQAALRKVFEGGHGPSSRWSRRIYEAATSFLLQGEGRHFIDVFWCPAHLRDLNDPRGRDGMTFSGTCVSRNDYVDRAAQRAAETGAPAPFTSFAVARMKVTQRLYQAWHEAMDSRKYRGHSMLLRQKDTGKSIKHTAKHWLLRRAGRKRRLFARAARFISGHFPHGEYRDRFNKDGPRHCLCDAQNPKYETRDHILYECPYWIRTHQPPARKPAAERLELISAGKQLFLQNEEQRISPQEIIDFLVLNPLVGTFEWTDLMEHVRLEVLPRREAGDENWQTAEYHYFRVMTDIRRRHYAWWRRNVAEDGKDAPHFFNEWFRRERNPTKYIEFKLRGTLNPREHAMLLNFERILDAGLDGGDPSATERELRRWARASRMREGMTYNPDPPRARRPRGAVPDALDFSSDSESGADEGVPE